MRPIGLLYDSFTPNFGDRAIGIALSHTLADAKIVFEFVREPSSLEGRFSALVIGGGHLIRAAGDRFYDRFRTGGKHILNAVGISEDAGPLDFLRRYRYVSVRSSVDRALVAGVRPDVKVVPCCSLALPAVTGFDPGIEDRTILIHMPPSCSGFMPRWPESVERAFPDYRKVLVSVNRFNNDQEYLSDIAYYKGWKLISGLAPDQMDAMIGHPYVHGILTTSLHAAMFALKHAKPFLGLPNVEKLRIFMMDHGLSYRVWCYEVSPGEMRGRLRPTPKDEELAILWQKDAAALKGHMARIVAECRAAIAESGGS